MSDDELMQHKYMAVSTITLATRYAIQGGLNETKAYEFSDRVIKIIDKLTDKNEIFMCLKYLHISLFIRLPQYSERKNKKRADATMIGSELMREVYYLNEEKLPTILFRTIALLIK